MSAAQGEVFLGSSGGKGSVARKNGKGQPMAGEYITKPHTALTPPALLLPFPGRVNDTLGLPYSMSMCFY